ncbi:LuxR C-terminal-related transcriptional regulator [Kitasatospora sp. NPDC056076]|uniref:LuxR C-terminal-related transcriptional regulator n=1 Tax=Kitasatospora sp. NPDC056076 TaxID=3345703 RepID=UPI0035DCE29C
MDITADNSSELAARSRELTAAEIDLYRDFAEHGPLRVEELLVGEGREAVAHSIEVLSASGLLKHVGPGRLAVADPAEAAGRVLKRWEDRVHATQLDLLRVRGQLAELALIHGARQHAHQGPHLERFESREDVVRLLDRYAGECSREVLAAQPGGPRPAAQLLAARDRDRQLLGRGVRMRTLYQYAARFDRTTVKYAEELIGLGADVRTVTSALPRFILFDRAVLFLPLGDAPGGALVIRSPDLIAFAAQAFELLWSTAEPIDKPREKEFVRSIAQQTKRSILRHLVQGDDDRATARALGISVRTCQRHVSEIMHGLGASSRLQLGYLIDRHGLLEDGADAPATPGGAARP